MKNISLVNFIINRTSHQRCSIRKAVLENFAKFTGKHRCQSLSFNKVAGLRSQPATLLKTRLWHYSCEFCEMFKNTFLENTSDGCFCIKQLLCYQLLIELTFASNQQSTLTTKFVSN